MPGRVSLYAKLSVHDFAEAESSSPVFTHRKRFWKINQGIPKSGKGKNVPICNMPTSAPCDTRRVLYNTKLSVNLCCGFEMKSSAVTCTRAKDY